MTRPWTRAALGVALALCLACSGWSPFAEECPALDEVGGLHLSYEVDVEAGLRQKRRAVAAELVSQLRERAPDAEVVPRLDGDEIVLAYPSAEAADAAAAAHTAMDAGLQCPVEARGRDGAGWRYRLCDGFAEEFSTAATEQTLEVVRRRLEAMDVPCPYVGLDGERLVVELVGVDASVLGVIADDSALIIAPDAAPSRVADLDAEVVRRITEAGPGAWSAFAEGLPVDLQPAWEDTDAGTVVRWLDTTQAIRGEALADVDVEQDVAMREYIAVELDEVGRAAFADLSTRYVGEPLVIAIDDEVIMAPIVREPIRGGRLSIDLGGGSETSAPDLALLLRNGSLSAPLVPMEERVIGPASGGP